MADILSTLRELRSLEEKRAHGTLSPEDEARFQELQDAVSSRGPKPGPPTPAPPGPGAPPVASLASPVSPEEAPFVDAELTEDPPEATQIQAAPTPMAERLDAPTAVAPAPVAAPEPQPESPVPMSAAELRQWNASFQAPGELSGQAPEAQEAPVESLAAEPFSPETASVEAPATSVFAAPPAEPVPALEPAPLEPAPGELAPAEAWLAPTPLPLAVEPPPEAPGALGAEGVLDLAPEPTVISGDSPMVWAPPDSPAAPLSPTQSPTPEPAHEDGWTASVSWSAGIPPEEVAPGLPALPDVIGDDEPTRLAPAIAAMDPFTADAYQPSTEQAQASNAEVSTKKYTPIGEAFAAGESRVVVHALGGAQKRGTLVDAHMNADFLELRLPNGEREMLSTASLKAVFFVVPIGQDVPKPVGDPVTVTLQDGHQLSGLSPDYQVGAVGFFLCPTDQRSRTAKIYIYAGSVKAIS